MGIKAHTADLALSPSPIPPKKTGTAWSLFPAPLCVFPVIFAQRRENNHPNTPLCPHFSHLASQAAPALCTPTQRGLYSDLPCLASPFSPHCNPILLLGKLQPARQPEPEPEQASSSRFEVLSHRLAPTSAGAQHLFSTAALRARPGGQGRLGGLHKPPSRPSQVLLHLHS